MLADEVICSLLNQIVTREHCAKVIGVRPKSIGTHHGAKRTVPREGGEGIKLELLQMHGCIRDAAALETQLH